MSFKDTVAADNMAVFLNDTEFADRRTVIYDGESYADIPIVLSGTKEKDRSVSAGSGDHGQGLYSATAVLHCALSSLEGNQPEQGMRIRINDEEGDEGFFREYYVVSSDCEMGMLKIGLEAIDE